MTGEPPQWRQAVVEALRAALAEWPDSLRPLAQEAECELAQRLQAGPADRVGAVAVPAAVFTGLRGVLPPAGLLTSAAATYLAWDLLDDEMDGDPPTFWSAHPTPQRMLGAHLLIATAAGHAAHGSLSGARELGGLYLAMAAAVIDGQLRGEQPLDASTLVEDVAAGIRARSGAMLAGFAEMAAVAAGADDGTRRAARRLGGELGLARQLVNDLTELLTGRTSDLRNRTATMIAAFALQRVSAGRRAALVEQLRTAADDEGLRRRLIGRELAPAITDVRLLAGLHLTAARTAADALAEHCADRRHIDMLLDGTSRILEQFSKGAS